MTPFWTQLLIALFLANAIPHLVFYQTDLRFLSLFGFSPKANLGYSLWNGVLACSIAVWAYGIKGLAGSGFFWGIAVVLVGYVLVGRYLYRRYNQA